jgi:hypothetical protein
LRRGWVCPGWGWTGRIGRCGGGAEGGEVDGGGADGVEGAGDHDVAGDREGDLDEGVGLDGLGLEVGAGFGREQEGLRERDIDGYEGDLGGGDGFDLAAQGVGAGVGLGGGEEGGEKQEDGRCAVDSGGWQRIGLGHWGESPGGLCYGLDCRAGTTDARLVG